MTKRTKRSFSIGVLAVAVVGALAARADDAIASYSSNGPTAIDKIVKPNLVAPGNQIVSLLASNTYISSAKTVNRVPSSLYSSSSSGLSGDYYRLSGTSMAAPLVTGTVALLLEKQPGLTPDQIKARLMKTARKRMPLQATAVDPVTGQVYKMQHDLFTIGAGYLDAGAALADTALLTRPANSPRVELSREGKLSLVFDKSVLSGDSILWGESAVWGDSTSAAYSVLWGEKSPWAASTTAKSATFDMLVRGDQ